jgi:hypothetical protein
MRCDGQTHADTMVRSCISLRGHLASRSATQFGSLLQCLKHTKVLGQLHKRNWSMQKQEREKAAKSAATLQYERVSHPGRGTVIREGGGSGKRHLS